MAALTALAHALLAVILTVFGFFQGAGGTVLAIFVLFFGSGCIAALAHAVPQVLDRWTFLRVRPGTVKAVMVFVMASMHWLVAAGATVAIFISDLLWRSVPLFFGSIAAYVGAAALFGASGYFLSTMERLPYKGSQTNA